MKSRRIGMKFNLIRYTTSYWLTWKYF